MSEDRPNILITLIKIAAVIITISLFLKNRRAVAIVAEVARRVAGLLGWSKGFSTLTTLARMKPKEKSREEAE